MSMRGLIYLLAAAGLAVAGGRTMADANGTIEATLNGLSIAIDGNTGSIVRMSYPGPGTMLDAKPDQAGIIDLAYPIAEFEPLRLASRYSKHVNVEKTSTSVTISWSGLGASRALGPPGAVDAKVRLKAAPDGESVLMSCEVTNRSKNSVKQVLFPDLHGLLPFAGDSGTYLRSGGVVTNPFQSIVPCTSGGFYAREEATDIEYSGGGSLSRGLMITRWVDYGGLNGGMSLFPKAWSGDPLSKVRLQRTESDPGVRLMYVHDVTVKPEQTWTSCEFVLTPHRFGWADGIRPYREFVKSNIRRAYPVPEHVRGGLGFRTVWMCKGYPADRERDAAFRFSDLPKLAGEAKEHGLDEMVVWFWQPPFQLPAPPYEHLGTPKELAKAVGDCRELGVNVALFVSIRSVSEPSASRYGWKVGSTGWTYHPELIPMFNAPYARERATASAVTSNPEWQRDVVSSCRQITQEFGASICWDQVIEKAPSGPLYKLFGEILKDVRSVAPEATFSGESVDSVENDADYLDYTWNWRLSGYQDVRGFTSAFPCPRVNANINRRVSDLKRGFMDNLYLNVFPSRPDDANGTAWIKDYPEISQALKQCAKLRKQFLPYFVNGTLIGECILSDECPGAHVSAYVLPDRALALVMNTDETQRAVSFVCNLEHWVKSASGRHEVRCYDGNGSLVGTQTVSGGTWRAQTAKLKHLDIALFEFVGTQ